MEEFTYKEIFDSEENHWWFVGTRNIFFSQIDKYVNKNNKIRILDIGCGTGIVIKRLEKYGYTFGIDISEDAIRFCRKRGLENIIKAEATQIPFNNNAFNLITIFDVLEHIKFDSIAISEVYRVLKKDGIAIVSVPANKFLWSCHDEVLHHYRRYSKEEIKGKILKCNFKILKISYYNFFLFTFIFIFRLFKKVFYKIKKEKAVKTDIICVPKFINSFLIFILNIECKIISKINIPFGVSILAVIRKL